VSAETKRIRASCVRRSEGYCECGCGRWLGEDGGQLDHAESRRVAQTVRNCWMLTPTCHEDRTNSRPSASVWLNRFASHCDLHGYEAEAARARDRLAFVETRSQLVSR
jgi:hypothetical protein